MDSSHHDVFVAFHADDQTAAAVLTGALVDAGFDPWSAWLDARAGAPWGEEIAAAIATSRAFVLVLTRTSAASPTVLREVQQAVQARLPIFCVRIGPIALAPELRPLLESAPTFEGTAEEPAACIGPLSMALSRIVPPRRSSPDETMIPARAPSTRGYVFISYVRSDAAFVQRLREVLESRRYGYWDYVVGNRDYHGALYRELEERIDGAAAFMTIVSDQWRESDWVAAEFIYAREARKPIFVLQAARLAKPLPILLNLQTRIDLSADFERGVATLAAELEKKGL